MTAAVLVVDDHPANTKLLSFVLKSKGLRVLTASHAEEARQVLEREVPALILMDVQLPGTDGLTLTRSLLADARYAAIPIVAVTAYAMQQDRDAAMAAGCVEFVSKPIDTRALGALVMRLLRLPEA